MDPAIQHESGRITPAPAGGDQLAGGFRTSRALIERRGAGIECSGRDRQQLQDVPSVERKIGDHVLVDFNAQRAGARFDHGRRA